MNTQVFSDPDTPSISNADNNPVTLNPPTAQHHMVEHANLHSAIFSLNLGTTSASPTPMNSPASSPTNTPLQPNTIVDLNLVPEEVTQDSFNEDTTPNFSLRRTWVDGTGPYITTGELRVQTDLSSDIESDSETVRMFNLDNLNDGCPEWVCRDEWDVGQIPEDANSIVQLVVNRVDRDRLRVELVNPNSRPSIKRVSEVGQHSSTAHHRSDSTIGTCLSQTMSLDTGLNIMFDSEPHGLGPGPPSPASINSDPGFLSSLHHTEVLPETNGAARKRFGPDLERLGRIIRQKLLYGFLQKEGTNDYSLAKSLSNSMPHIFSTDSMIRVYPNGCWEAGLKQLP